MGVTTEKTRGWFEVSPSILQQFVMAPEGWEIVGVEWHAPEQRIRIIVDGDNVPAGHAGELRAEYIRHDDGLFVKWKPAEKPGPMTFMRINGTHRCFFCKREESEHGPDRVCPMGDR
jgi:hypothetical protein